MFVFFFYCCCFVSSPVCPSGWAEGSSKENRSRSVDSLRDALCAPVREVLLTNDRYSKASFSVLKKYLTIAYKLNQYFKMAEGHPERSHYPEHSLFHDGCRIRSFSRVDTTVQFANVAQELSLACFINLWPPVPSLVVHMVRRSTIGSLRGC